MHNFFLYVYFYSLHVSGSRVPIIRRINCINATPGVCHSVDLHTRRSSTQSDIRSVVNKFPEFFALVRSLVTTPAARGIIPKVSWASVMKASFVRIVCDATLAFIKRCNILSAIIEMADFHEQHACINFCFKLRKAATGCYEMLKTAFG